MKKLIIVFVLLLLVPFSKVFAVCDYNEIAKLKKMAANVTISYDYVETDSSVRFKITLNNLRDEMYFIDKLTYTQYDYQSEEQTISNYRSGQTVRYDFYSTDPECAEYPLYTARVVLPSYNQYYQDEVCIGASEYSLCQKWSSHNLSYDNFVKKVTEYKNSLVEPEEPVIEENPSGTITFVQLIINFLLDYYIYIIIVLSLGLIALLAIRKKDDIYI